MAQTNITELTGYDEIYKTGQLMGAMQSLEDFDARRWPQIKHGWINVGQSPRYVR